MTNLPLTPVVDVEYQISPIAAPRRGFNLGLIVGDTPVQQDRVVVYSGLQEMIDAGFSTGDPEYKAAALYFSATSSPRELAIGRQFSGETPLAALQECREANTEWYIAYSTTAADGDQEEIAEYFEAITPYSFYFLQTDAADVLSNTPGNLFATLKAKQFRRTLGMYSTNEHAIAAVMGYAMGQTSDFANSAYTLDLKQLPGVTADDLTTQEVTNIQANNGNFYIKRGDFYTIFQNGKGFNGGWFDETIYLDKLANEIQLSVMDLLYSVPKVPQTEAGVASIKTVISIACQSLVEIGFIAPGRWTGGDILSLKNGDFLPNGYLVLSEPIATQPQADRDARKAPPIYVPIKLAGAIQTVLIRIDVNR